MRKRERLGNSKQHKDLRRERHHEVKGVEKDCGITEQSGSEVVGRNEIGELGRG